MAATKRIAMLSIHSSPVAALGGNKTGGMNVYVRELSAALSQMGIDVEVFTRKQHPDAPECVEINDSVRVNFIEGGPPTPTKSTAEQFPYMPAVTANLLRFAEDRAWQFDVIHSHYWLSGVVAKQLKAAWRIPAIQMFHTLGEMKNRIAAPGTRNDPPLRIQQEQKIVDFSDVLIAATPAERIQLLWLYGTTMEKIRIISPGVDLEKFYPLPETEAKAAIGVPADKHMILFVGRIERLKGIDHLIHAVGLLRETAPELSDALKLFIVGGNLDERSNPTTEMGRLNALVDSLALEQSVQFLGARDQENLQAYYCASDAVIMPSHYESFGMVALEAMACGTPVVASEVGGLAYLVHDGINGFHVPDRDPTELAQKIQMLLEMPALRKELSVNAVTYARKYSWQSVAEKIVAVYEEVLTLSPGG